MLRLRSSQRLIRGFSSAQLPSEADVVVIGGGSIGCSTLYHLTRLGIKNAVLLERHKITAGTTWHTAGLLWRLRTDDVETRLVDWTRTLNKTILPEETGESTGWIENGGLFVAHNKQRLEEYKRLMTLGNSFNVESHLLTPAETKKLYPLMNTEDIYGSLFSPGDGTLDPSAWCNSLLKAAKLRGAQFFEDCSVSDFLIERDDVFDYQKVTGVKTSQGDIRAQYVVLCGGAWGPSLAKDLSINLPTLALQHAYVTTDRIEGLSHNVPNVRDHDLAIYLKTVGDALSVGAYEENPFFCNDKITNDFKFGLFNLDWDHFSPTYMKAIKLVPSLENVGIKSEISGPMSFTPDHKPLMGENPKVRNLFFGCGMEVGMLAGGGLGRELAHWVVKGRPSMHMYHSDLSRFSLALTGDPTWLKERCHEGFANMYKSVWPHDEPLSARNKRFTPFYARLSDQGAVFQERHGWERPGWFPKDGKLSPVLPYDYYGAYPDTPAHPDYTYLKRLAGDYTFEWPEHTNVIKSECLNTRNNVSVFDMSYFGKFFLTGPDAQAAADWIFSANVQKKPGTTVYSCMLNKFGGVESDLTVSILEPGTGENVMQPKLKSGEPGFYIAAGGGVAEYCWQHIRRIIQDKKFQVTIWDDTEEAGILSVQGPKSRELLQTLTDTNLSELKFSTHSMINIAGFPCRIIRLSFVGELGYELHIPKNHCLAIYDALFEKGSKFGLENAGYRAIDSLSLEKGYRFWDSDLRAEDTPLEAGIAFTCKLKTDLPFLGRASLENQRRDGLFKRIACFTVDDIKRPLWGFERILREGQPVGFIRRAEYGFHVEKSIAYGYVHHPDKQAVTTDWLKSGNYELDRMGECLPATLHLKTPFDPNNDRLKGHYHS